MPATLHDVVHVQQMVLLDQRQLHGDSRHPFHVAAVGSRVGVIGRENTLSATGSEICVLPCARPEIRPLTAGAEPIDQPIAARSKDIRGPHDGLELLLQLVPVPRGVQRRSSKHVEGKSSFARARRPPPTREAWS